MCTGISVGNNVCVEGRHITTSSAPIITSTPSTISTTYGIASTAHMDITTLQGRYTYLMMLQPAGSMSSMDNRHHIITSYYNI